ncbi:MAG TPA: class I SAM-dependent methyltransferase [Polyangiaceae bacterium]|nr:class I SAM-dependent methyltransferase [Polyangiaceae bacterium]
MANLLLHSLKEFDEIIFGTLDRAKPRRILEIGSETGAFSKMLIRYCELNRACLTIVEPYPTAELSAIAERSDNIRLFAGKSVDYLSRFECEADVVLIDGDHNYFTVSSELEAIHASWAKSETSGIVILHDVGFPCGRRDSYYDPPAIPEAARHPHSYELGITVGSAELVRGGFRGEGSFAWALHEGGPKNGVLTAVEDFLASHGEYGYRAVDAVFGLGVVTLRDTPQERIAHDVFGAYDNELTRRLERNRMALYLKVIELQDALNARAASVEAP